MSGRFGEEKMRTVVRYEFIDHPVSGVITLPGDKSWVTDIEECD
jgi:hypothetical protein